MNIVSKTRSYALSTLATALGSPLILGAAHSANVAATTGGAFSACAVGGAMAVIGIFTAQPEVSLAGLLIGGLYC